MEKSTPKKLFNKIFNSQSNSKKNSSTVSPQEWTPSFDALDLSTHRSATNRRSNEEVYNPSQHQSSIVRSGSMQRRYSLSNVHESGQRRLLAAKKAEYLEKMQAFDDLIQRRR